MRILIISQYYSPDPFRLHEAAEGLVNDGHEVTVLTGTPNYVTKKSIKEYSITIKSGRDTGVKVVRVPTIRRRSGLFSIALSYLTYAVNGSLRVLLLKNKYDVIFLYQLSPILMILPAWMARLKFKKKLALYCLDLWPESMVGMGITRNSILYRIMYKFSIKAYSSVDYLAYTSRKFKKYFKENLKVNVEKMSYIPQFAEDIYSRIKKVDHDGINYVFAGNIGEAQSVETIIRAATLVKNKSIKWHIVGDGTFYEKCKKLTTKLGVSQKVIFYGRRPVEEMSYFFSMADALIVTLSRNEIISYTLPGKVQSYMAAGVPLLVAASGETPDIVKEAKCGLCCPAENPKELARIADKMADMDRSDMADCAKKYYELHFTKKQYIQSIENMLESLL